MNKEAFTSQIDVWHPWLGLKQKIGTQALQGNQIPPFFFLNDLCVYLSMHLCTCSQHVEHKHTREGSSLTQHRGTHQQCLHQQRINSKEMLLPTTLCSWKWHYGVNTIVCLMPGESLGGWSRFGEIISEPVNIRGDGAFSAVHRASVSNNTIIGVQSKIMQTLGT